MTQAKMLYDINYLFGMLIMSLVLAQHAMLMVENPLGLQEVRNSSVLLHVNHQ